MVERVSMPCSSHGDSDTYTHSAVDSFPSTVSGLSAVSTGSHVTDVSRSHTPPERDVNSNKSSCAINVDVVSTVKNVSHQGVSAALLMQFIDITCFAKNSSLNGF